jgi:hypothetical protein
MNKTKILFISSFVLIALFLASCSVSPCDCARAQATNDAKTLKKCEEKVNKMSQEESIKWYKKEAACLETQ